MEMPGGTGRLSQPMGRHRDMAHALSHSRVGCCRGRAGHRWSSQYTSPSFLISVCVRYLSILSLPSVQFYWSIINWSIQMYMFKAYNAAMYNSVFCNTHCEVMPTTNWLASPPLHMPLSFVCFLHPHNGTCTILSQLLWLESLLLTMLSWQSLPPFPQTGFTYAQGPWILLVTPVLEYWKYFSSTLGKFQPYFIISVNILRIEGSQCQSYARRFIWLDVW